MLFNSVGFLVLFLPITYFVFWHLTTRSQRYVWLTLTGYLFYSFWSVKFCALMALSTAVSYIAPENTRSLRMAERLGAFHDRHAPNADPANPDTVWRHRPEAWR